MTTTPIAAAAPSDRLAYTPAELAALLGVHKETVLRKIRNGELLAFKLGSRVLVRHEQFVAFCKSQEKAKKK